MSSKVSAVTPLGLRGFTFADLHQPARLRELYGRFVEQVKATEPELWAQWSQYREVPESLSAIARGNIVVAMAPHVSRFVSALFSVGADADALTAATRAYDVLFRFKIDFVRRRALPLLKAGAHVEATAEDHALAESITFGMRQLEPSLSSEASHDAEMRLAAYGCALLDRESHRQGRLGRRSLGEGGRRRRDRIAEALVRRARSRSAVSRLGGVPFPREPRLRPSRPGAAAGSEAARGDGRPRREAAPPRRASSSPTTAIRRREILSEIHYCVLCHERDKDTCSKGIRDKEGKVTTNPLGIPLAGCPLDEKISEMHTVRKRGDAIGALAIVTVDNPMCPGTGHRICNDCMKACIYQKQEPVNIPQIETGVLTDVLEHAVGRRDLRAAHALEPAQHPAALRARHTTARTCSSSASGPPATRCRITC